MGCNFVTECLTVPGCSYEPGDRRPGGCQPFTVFLLPGQGDKKASGAQPQGLRAAELVPALCRPSPVTEIWGPSTSCCSLPPASPSCPAPPPSASPTPHRFGQMLCSQLCRHVPHFSPWLSLLALRLQYESGFLGCCLPRGREWSREMSQRRRGSQDLPSQPRSWAAVSQEAAEPSPAQEGRAGPADHPALSLKPSKASTLGPRLQREWINWQNAKPVTRYLVLLSNVKSQEGEISHVCFSFLTPPSLLPRGY